MRFKYARTFKDDLDAFGKDLRSSATIPPWRADDLLTPAKEVFEHLTEIREFARRAALDWINNHYISADG